MQPADVEKYVLMALDHVGWYRSCWFPQVQRESLNFPGGPTDEEARAALFRLIRAGAVEAGKTVDGTFVRVSDPIPDVLADLETNAKSAYDLQLSEEAVRQLHAALERGKLPCRGHFQILAHGESTSTRI